MTPSGWVSARASVGAVSALNADNHPRNYRVESEGTAPCTSAALEGKFWASP